MQIIKKTNNLRLVSSYQKNHSICLAMYVIIAVFALFSQLLSMQFFSGITSEEMIGQTIKFSNIIGWLVFANAIAMAIICGLAKKKNIEILPKSVGIINFVVTAATALSMFTTIIVLTPLYAGVNNPDRGAITLYQFSSMIFNIIIPILSIFTYICYVKHQQTKLPEVLYAYVPLVAYTVFYLVMAYTQPSTSAFKDWYSLCALGVGGTVAFALLIYAMFFGILFLLRYLNNKIHVKTLTVKIFMQCFIIVLVFIGIWLMFDGEEIWEVFKWFTNLSNFVFGIAAICSLVYYIKQARGLNIEMPRWANRFKLCGVAGVGLTICIVLFAFLPILLLQGDYGSARGLFCVRSFYYHVLVPILGVGSYIAFEHNNLKLKETLFTIIEPIVYLIVYTVIAYVYARTNLPSKYHDWYQLLNILGEEWGWSIPIIGGIAGWLIAFLCWLGNRKVDIDGPKLFAVRKPYFAQIPIDK